MKTNVEKTISIFNYIYIQLELKFIMLTDLSGIYDITKQ